VIHEYFKACNRLITIAFIASQVLSYGASMASSYWLSDWSNESSNEAIALRNKYFRLGIYSLLGFLKPVLGAISSLFFIAMFIKAAKLLHDKLLLNVLKLNLQFFESTPTGRIVNRFSKDVEATVHSIPSSVKSLIECFLSILMTVIIISSSTPYFILGLVPIAISYLLIQRYFVPTNRQLKRLQMVSRSPIFSHFSETQAGISTIRAYRAQERFVRTMENNIDEYFVYYFSTTVSNRWLALRLELVGNIITIMASLFAILSRDTLSAGIAGILLPFEVFLVLLI